MPKRSEANANETPFQRMERMTKALIAVPKSEVEKLKKKQQRAAARRAQQ
ncbi:MAG TPA: hypothetical protein VEZ14_03880 [Dehalococcoidia bacterium]|nr:hypothetical protein [Dehalococcoidia bacterium]